MSNNKKEIITIKMNTIYNNNNNNKNNHNYDECYVAYSGVGDD